MVSPRQKVFDGIYRASEIGLLVELPVKFSLGCELHILFGMEVGHVELMITASRMTLKDIRINQNQYGSLCHAND
jgi:hypothetical protein